MPGQRTKEDPLAGRQWLILCAIAFSRIAFGYQFQTVGSLGPVLVQAFAMDFTLLGSLVGAYMLPGIFASIPLGLLGRRFGDHVMVGSGVSLMAVGGLVAAYAASTRGIYAGRLISGTGAVAMIVLQGKVVADWFHGRQLMFGLGVSVAAFPIGVGMAQLIAPPLANAFGWPAAFLFGAGLAAGAAAWFIGFYRQSPLAAPVPRRFSFPSRHECVLVMLAGAIWTFYTSPYSALLAYAPSLLTRRGETAGAIALMITIATWGNVPAILLGGRFANRFGHLNLFLVGTTALAVGLALLGVESWPLTCAFLVGVVGCVHPSVIMAAGTLSARPENRAVGMSLFYTTYYIGGTAVPTLCGRAADFYGGAEGALFCAAGIALLGVPAFLLHRRLAARPAPYPGPARKIAPGRA